MAIFGLGNPQILSPEEGSKKKEERLNLAEIKTEEELEAYLNSEETYQEYRAEMKMLKPKWSDEQFRRCYKLYCEGLKYSFQNRNSANNPATAF